MVSPQLLQGFFLGTAEPAENHALDTRLCDVLCPVELDGDWAGLGLHGGQYSRGISIANLSIFQAGYVRK